GIDNDVNLRVRFFVQEIHESPAHQLRAETQIRVFGERVMLPAAAHLDRVAPPDTGSAVEVEKVAAAIARRLLNNEMSIKHDRLQTRQQVVGTVDMGPAHLCAADDRIGEVIDQLAQKIRLRHKVGIENRDQ